MPLPERELIARLRDLTGGPRRKALAAGIGDDSAVLRLPGSHEVLVTTDFSLEGVHFRREWQPPKCIGHRCLARGLSDIAAMGGRPLAAFLSLALPPDIPQTWVDRFLRGFLRLAHKHNVSLAGGDTSQSPGGVLADVIVLGTVPRGKALLRSGARAGDQIYVTGALGESATLLQELLTKSSKRRSDIYPPPRIEVGAWLQRNGIASAVIDISDGLSTDLLHICEESGVGARVQADAVPIHRRALKAADPLELALHGGEDYELVFTAAKAKRVPGQIAGVKVTRIGEIVPAAKRKPRIRLLRDGREQPLQPRGWEHFREER